MANRTHFTVTTFKVWNALHQLSEQKPYPPTLREIGDLCGGLSTSLVDRHLGKLEAAACVERFPGKSRGVRLLQKPEC